MTVSNDDHDAPDRAAGVLYVVATPIGNLEDISARALRILGEVDLIAAEDTRTTRKLLTRYGLHVRMVSLFDANVRRRIPQLLKELDEGKQIALVSEAGTPVISDPGALLVRAAAEAGHTVTPIPGPTAIAALLSVAGMPADKFTFLGFLPRKAGQRRRLIESIAEQPWTTVFYESPYRIIATLEALHEVLGDREHRHRAGDDQAARGDIPRDLTEAIEHFQKPRGEFTIAVAGADN